MVPRKSILLIVVGVIQTIFWLPYLLLPPWTLTMPILVGHRWIVRVPSNFDLGIATDFLPAVVMVIAGSLVIAVGFRKRLTSWFVDIVVWLDVLAVITLVVTDIIGTASGVRFWNSYYLALTPFQFVPPIAGISLMKRRARFI